MARRHYSKKSASTYLSLTILHQVNVLIAVLRIPKQKLCSILSSSVQAASVIYPQSRVWNAHGLLPAKTVYRDLTSPCAATARLGNEC